MHVQRLTPAHAAAISDCFRSVYGESYANEIFYDLDGLAAALQSGNLYSVGALADDGRIMGHMAMSVHKGALHPELGNTVVDPAARGEGLAWQVGAALTDWAIEKGFEGYLHYPTTDHHIMQKQSVKRGFETGLMLGYIPAETDGKVTDTKPRLRGAATIVFEPLTSLSHQEKSFLPDRYQKLVRNMAEQCGITREWVSVADDNSVADPSVTHISTFAKRDLVRLEFERVGVNAGDEINRVLALPQACKQVDFRLGDDGVAYGVDLAIHSGFVFCGWLPGYRETDVLRLQSVDERSDLDPGVVNPMGEQLKAYVRQELGL